MILGSDVDNASVGGVADDDTMIDDEDMIDCWHNVDGASMRMAIAWQSWVDICDKKLERTMKK